jgi:hypothetical protein
MVNPAHTIAADAALFLAQEIVQMRFLWKSIVSKITASGGSLDGNKIRQ